MSRRATSLRILQQQRQATPSPAITPLPPTKEAPPRAWEAGLFNYRCRGKPQPRLLQMDGTPICTLPIPTHLTNNGVDDEKKWPIVRY